MNTAEDGHRTEQSPEELQGLRLIVAGGGTGGHLFPGIAVADAIKRRLPKSRVLFVTTGRPIERRVLSRTDYETVEIAAAGFKGVGFKAKMLALIKVPAGFAASFGIFLRFKPDAVLGMGAYSAAPVILAAWAARIFRAVHEQNRIAGMTNRLLARFADRIYVSFPDTVTGKRCADTRFTGNPIRSDIGKEAAGKDKQKFNVLIAGGSQGAHKINTAALAALPGLKSPETMRFIHQTGTADLEMVRQGYEDAGIDALVEAFFDDMAACYAAADFIICRAGATSVAEVAAAGIPAVFIPYPYAADNHQYYNAKALEDEGAAEVIPQEAADGRLLAGRINYYAREEGVRMQMQERMRAFARPDAARAIAEDMLNCLGRGRPGGKQKKSGDAGG
ncbi:MAG: undecaprenyldiphospho-muramoylpentapeptide beta-N-acetylglucosaminyltransferase [Desulfosalsimonadaceae bacterium]